MKQRKNKKGYLQNLQVNANKNIVVDIKVSMEDGSNQDIRKNNKEIV